MLDQNKFEKILNNYLSNALKFTPPNGQISVEAKQEGQHLVFAVKDSGRGIHPEDLPHVFDRFYQSNRADTPAEGGTGIGLSLSKELAQLLGGEVWAESVLGEGSSFYLRLPIIQAAVNKNVSPASVIDQEEVLTATIVESAPIAKQDIHILVVEDNKDLRDYYQIILSAYQVTLAENGQVALNLLNTQPLPNLIISDLMMPVMDGMQLLNALKSSDALRHLPVIMLTARTNRQDKIKALRFGIDDYLNKPFDEEELLVRIANLLKYSASRNEPLAKENSPAPSSGLSQTEMNWLEELESYILSQLTKPGLSVANIAHEFAMSESTLLRQLKKLTGLTPNQYLREVKLNQAQMYLTNQTFRNVAEVAYQVGFKDPTSFTRSFKKRFGKAPTAMAM
jgi:DNA-binding response OmpR family regulator